jgi:hypothetical protein
MDETMYVSLPDEQGDMVDIELRWVKQSLPTAYEHPVWGKSTGLMLTNRVLTEQQRTALAQALAKEQDAHKE